MMAHLFILILNRIINITKKTKATMLGAGAKIYENIQNNYKSNKKYILKILMFYIYWLPSQSRNF
jgi:hypothetical protein